MLEGRLNALQQQFSKQQSSEAEKFKVLDMMLRRLQDEVSVTPKWLENESLHHFCLVGWNPS